jgi:hypothetical protein
LINILPPKYRPWFNQINKKINIYYKETKNGSKRID